MPRPAPWRPLVLSLALAASAAGCSAVEKLTGGDSCTGPAPFTPGATVSGVTSEGANNCMSPDGTRTQLFTMTLSQQTDVELQLTANGFPPHLGLYNADDSPIARTNDAPWRIKAFLPPGGYKIVVASTSSRDGPYTLTSVPVEQKGCTPGRAVTAIGATITGALTADDCADVGFPFDIYETYSATSATVTVTITAGARVNVAVVSPGGLLASRDFAAAGTASLTVNVPAKSYYAVRIQAVKVNNALVLPVPYTIVLK